MQVEIQHYPRSTLSEFADAHGLRMIVKERGGDFVRSPDARYYAHFDGAEVTNGSVLSGVYGNGCTPDAAIANYIPQISEKRLVIGAYTPERREIQVPILTTVELSP